MPVVVEKDPLASGGNLPPWSPELNVAPGSTVRREERPSKRNLPPAAPGAWHGAGLRNLGLALALALAVVAVAAPGAFAQASNWSDCWYAEGQEFSTYGAYQNGVVYVDRGQGGGPTGQADASAGACMDLEGSATVLGVPFDGGAVDLGAEPGEQEGYAVFDGDNNNAPNGDYSTTGYFGVSNFESEEGYRDTECNGWDQGWGENSGGCFNCDGCGSASFAVPVPLLVCDHSGWWGSTWWQSGRDGCEAWVWRFPSRAEPAPSGPSTDGGDGGVSPFAIEWSPFPAPGEAEEEPRAGAGSDAEPGAPVTRPQESNSASAPLTSPIGAGGLGVDPMVPGVAEPVTVVEQPGSWPLPSFVDTAGNPGWFGSGLTRTGAANGRRSTVAVGGGKVFVTAPTWTSSTAQVEVYNARTLVRERVIAPPTQSWSSSKLPLALGYYRGELFVGIGSDCCMGAGGAESAAAQGKPSVESVVVFNAETGAYLRSFPLLVPGVRSIDLAWGELWAVGHNATADGRDDYLGSNLVSVYDAQTGALKGTSLHALSSQGVDLGKSHPYGSARVPWADDISIAPETGGAFVGAKLFKRAALGLGASEGTECGVPLAGDQARTDATCLLTGNTDAVWGMQWLLEAVNWYKPNTVPQAAWDCWVHEYRLGQGTRGGALYPVPHLPGEYLNFARKWIPQQCGGAHGYPAFSFAAPKLTDVAYNQRETRIDIWGPMAGTDWLRLDKCVNYAVSDADIFVIADRGERWLEPARNFEKIDLYIDGQLRQTKTGVENAIGSFCLPTTSILNGTRELKLEARVAGKTLTSINPNLHIDNALPAGTVTNPGQYVRGATTLRGTATDTDSGPKTWELEVQPAGGAWQRICGPVNQPAGTTSLSCNWNTASGQHPDGLYNVRVKITDNSSDGGNSAYSPPVSTTVDNTSPALAHFAPALGVDADDIVVASAVDVQWVQTDGGSGISATTISYNAAPNGACDGAWTAIGSASGAGPAAVEWDTRSVPAGLTCMQAASADRAGNRATARWQVVLSAARPQAPQSTASSYHYAGIWMGFLRPRWLGYSWGSLASLTTPGWRASFDVSNHYVEHTAARVANGGSFTTRSVEVGLISEGHCRAYRYGQGDPSATMPEQGDEEAWMVYGSLVYASSDNAPSPGFQTQCIGPASSGAKYRFRTQMDPATPAYPYGAMYYAPYDGAGQLGGERPIYVASSQDADQTEHEYAMKNYDGLNGSQVQSETTTGNRYMDFTYEQPGYRRGYSGSVAGYVAPGAPGLPGWAMNDDHQPSPSYRACLTTSSIGAITRILTVGPNRACP